MARPKALIFWFKKQEIAQPVFCRARLLKQLNGSAKLKDNKLKPSLTKSRIFSAVLFTVIAPLIGGCVSLLPKPGKPPITVPLRASQDVVRKAQQAPFTIAVGMPNMPRSLSGSQVAAIQDDGSIAYIERLALASNAANSIQNVILGTFDKAVAFRSAVRASANARADYEIILDVSRFEVTLPKWRTAGVANVEITARLVDVKLRRPLASRIFTSSAPAEHGDASNAALALETATQTISVEIMDWAISAGRAFYQSSADSAIR